MLFFRACALASEVLSPRPEQPVLPVNQANVKELDRILANENEAPQLYHL